MNQPTHKIPPFILHLEEFESGGSKYIRCQSDDQQHYLSHLLSGAGACLFAEDLPRIQALANAHGWVVRLIPANTERSGGTSAAVTGSES